jgi:serine protease AprX
MTEDGLDRRQFVKAVGAAGVAGVAFSGQAAASGGFSTAVVDEQFEASGGPQEAFVVFDANEDIDRLGDLDLVDGFHAYEVLPIGFARLTPDQVETVAEWEEVRRVKRNEELEWYNDDASRAAMAVDAVHDHAEDGTIQGVDGEGVDAVIIDSGVDASHPAVDGRVESNWRWADDALGPRNEMWLDLGPSDSDEIGHGMHCAGILAGDGDGAGAGDFHGMAPATRLSVYSTTGGVYLPYVVGAWDHMLARVDDPDVDFDPVVVSNSYGVARGVEYNPNDPVNVASWEAFQRGILPVWAYGNDGPDKGTANRFAKAPHVLGVGAGRKTDMGLTDFSSRGRALDRNDTRYDRERLLRNLERFHDAQSGSRTVVETETFGGTLGPAANSGPLVSGVDEEANIATHTVETFDNADLLTMTFTTDPPSQWVRVTVYEGQGTDGERIAVMGEEPVHQHRTLTVDVEGGRDYTVELEPEATGIAEYTLETEQVETGGQDPGTHRPVTLARPGIVTHGNSVMSSFDPHDALAPLSADPEPLYGRISGTSMACPAAAGIAVLVVQTYREVAGEDPDPADVLRILENTAETAHEDYTPYNAGAGWVDAEAAVDLAREVASGGNAPRANRQVLVESD